MTHVGMLLDTGGDMADATTIVVIAALEGLSHSGVKKKQ